ncbi:response regulator transcription factor [Tissierella sp. MSJ-40]|uniref:Response regulator transcription factor n=1 Tax=Tissierella simiarum TaxID=2841534 RepID=A0ABS6E7V8_9FIRM|nr:response regulator transcription factor [Tissierella simiarum]MBU5439006.1 response regulator transcription factor [Tissierella simiarum]
MEHKNILIVEDEKNIVEVIEAYLSKEGFNVFTAEDGKKALELFHSNNIHLIILDLMIPKISGEEVCTNIRSTSDVPIIMLTAKADEDHRVQGLSIGADDYVIKPFSPRELTSRVKALLRRSYRDYGPLAENLVFNDGDLEIEVEKMIVRKQNKSVNLTVNEFKILLALVSNPGVVLSREQLIENSFGHQYEGFDRTIDTYIKNIRQKIEDNPKKPKYVLTVYGAGYKFGII